MRVQRHLGKYRDQPRGRAYGNRASRLLTEQELDVWYKTIEQIRDKKYTEDVQKLNKIYGN